MPPRLPPLVDARGAAIPLGAEIGRGGEGAVFHVAGAPDLVAKVYHQPVSPDRARKLRAMSSLGAASLTNVAAWPTSTLHPGPEGPGGAVVGLVMPKVAGYLEVHRLYSPVQRRTDFPNADWRFLVWAARNIAAAVAAIHQAGHVIGDVNQNNVVVSPTAMARLIDCDSFQVRDGQRWHLCEVGVPHFTPPELQGASFHGVVRTAQHDAFGLAVLVFHLLFMGRHPFVGVYSGRDMLIEEAIREFRFAFGTQASSIGLRPPPASLPLAAASVRVAELFERAFSATAARTGGRPAATEWADALEALSRETVACSAFRGHTYHKSLPQCPWCALEAAGGPNFFVTTFVGTATGPINVAALWAEIMAVPAPTAVPTWLNIQPASAGKPLVGAPVARQMRVVAAGARLASFSLAASVVGLLVDAWLATQIWFVASLLLWLGLSHKNGLPAEKKRRADALKTAKDRLQQAQTAVERTNASASREMSLAKESFQSKLAALNAIRAELLLLPDERTRALARLDQDRRKQQMKVHLERKSIRRAQIDGIGPGRLAALLSFGIETAADVSNSSVQRVPGFGPGLAGRLVAWRRAQEATFVFNANQPVDPAAVQRVEQQIARRRQDLEAALRAGAHELRQISSHAQSRHSALSAERERYFSEASRQAVAVHQAEADMAAV